jgi:uncharacterized membrane protein YfcA
MDTQTILIVLAAFFVSAFLKGFTGLGFSTICLGILAMFMDLKLAIPLVFLPSLCSNIIVMVQAGRFFEALRRFWPLFLSALPGLVIGILLLGNSDSEGPRALLGVVMLSYGIWALKNEIIPITAKQEKTLQVPVGFISGLVNGLTGSQLMPIMPYLLSVKMDRDIFIQTINCAFTLNTLVMIAGFGKLGMITLPILYLSATGIIPVALGIFLGGILRKRITDLIFRKAVLVLLVLMGFNLLMMTIFQL